jgi:type IV secretory pathway TraG/TraD family ATPase VirD4
MVATSKADKIEHPQGQYRTPDEILGDESLSDDEKKQALNVWEQDARQLLTASGEGMPGREEGLNKDNHNQLSQIERAKDELGEPLAYKPSH